jgi:GNAT superfamily N-acetyltransferase
MTAVELVRDLTAEDIPGVVALRDRFIVRANALHHLTLEHNPKTTRFICEQALAHPDDALALVAPDADGEIQGVLIVGIRPCAINEDVSLAAQSMFYVEPAVRGQGVGTMLVTMAEVWAKDRGAQYLCLFYHDGMAEAAWFTHLGYTPIEHGVVKEVR